MVSTNTRKMDKSTVLKSTILFLKNHNGECFMLIKLRTKQRYFYYDKSMIKTFSELAVRSRAHEIQEDWKPSFLSNEEFTHLTLEVRHRNLLILTTNRVKEN